MPVQATKRQEPLTGSATDLLMSFPQERLEDWYVGLRDYVRWIWRRRYSIERVAQLEGDLVKSEQKFQQIGRVGAGPGRGAKMWYRALEESQGAASYIASHIASRRFFLAHLQGKTSAGQKTRNEIRDGVEREMILKLLHFILARM